MRKSTHYFFKLSTFSKRLEEWLRENDALQPDAKNYVLNWIKDGLHDWDITRDIPWGFPSRLKRPKARSSTAGSTTISVISPRP